MIDLLGCDQGFCSGVGMVLSCTWDARGVGLRSWLARMGLSFPLSRMFTACCIKAFEHEHDGSMF
jgi:hypothetical protein